MVGMEAATSALALVPVRIQPDPSEWQWSASNFLEDSITKHLVKETA